eukprot:3934552-Rhodomonas_salina.1
MVLPGFPVPAAPHQVRSTLGGSFAMSGTEIAYGPTGSPVLSSRMGLLSCCGVGTEIAYGATLLWEAWYLLCVLET